MTTPSSPEKTTLPHPPKLLDQVVAKIRFKHYSRRTERSYAHWIKRFIFFHDKRHPKEMGAPEGREKSIGQNGLGTTKGSKLSAPAAWYAFVSRLFSVYCRRSL